MAPRTNTLWRDGTLRETRLVVNGLPDAPEAVLPDEVFVGPKGTQVQIVRKPRKYYDVDTWVVTTFARPDDGTEYDTFAAAFAAALALVREAVE